MKEQGKKTQKRTKSKEQKKKKSPIERLIRLVFV